MHISSPRLITNATYKDGEIVWARCRSIRTFLFQAACLLSHSNISHMCVNSAWINASVLVRASGKWFVSVFGQMIVRHKRLCEYIWQSNGKSQLIRTSQPNNAFWKWHNTTHTHTHFQLRGWSYTSAFILWYDVLFGKKKKNTAAVTVARTFPSHSLRLMLL